MQPIQYFTLNQKLESEFGSQLIHLSNFERQYEQSDFSICKLEKPTDRASMLCKLDSSCNTSMVHFFPFLACIANFTFDHPDAITISAVSPNYTYYIGLKHFLKLH